MNLCPNPTETGSIAVSLPVLVFKKLFSFLEENERKSMRLVCTSWNFMVRTLCLHPNSIYMGIKEDSERADFEYDEEHNKGFYQCLDMNLHEGIYYYYTPASSMKLKNIWTKYFRAPLLDNIDGFRELVHNVRHLEIERIHFEDRQSVIDFLDYFINLEKLSVKYCHLTKESLANSLRSLSLPSRIKCLDVEHRHNDVYLHGIFTSCCTETKNLEEFSLKIVNCENILRKECYGTNYGFSDAMVSKIRMIIINHQESLKRLRIKWDTKEVCSKDRTKTISLHSVAASLLPMLTLFRTNSFLSLTELSIELSEINTLHPDFTTVLVPFIHEQVNKTLRKITLSELTGIFVPGSLFQAITPSNKDNHMNEFDMNLSLKITKVGDPRIAELNRQLLAWKIPKTFMTKLVVEVGEVNENEAQISEEFPRLFIREYSCLMSQKIKYPNLTEFQLICHSKLFESFSIPKICYQYLNLTTMSIVDGQVFQYDEREEINSQYSRMSSASVTDFDMRFIIEKLSRLQTLKIWANMESLTDFGIVGRSSEQIQKSESCQYEAEYFLTMISENGMKYRDKSISSGLKDLQHLSLRGVGNKITNLTVSLGFHGLKNLKTLEILGDHQITEEFQEVLRTIVGYHININ